jgi:hypothetical protein
MKWRRLTANVLPIACSVYTAGQAWHDVGIDLCAAGLGAVADEVVDVAVILSEGEGDAVQGASWDDALVLGLCEARPFVGSVVWHSIDDGCVVLRAVVNGAGVWSW